MGHPETISILRKSKLIDMSEENIDERNATPWACSGGYHRAVGFLIMCNRADVDEEDVDD